MPDSSLLSTFPIELVHEIIKQSDVSTLAQWSLVSRAFLSFAGPLLYEIVTLSREEDVVPFIIRLNLYICRFRNDTPPPLLPLNSLKRLLILSLPSKDEYYKLAEDPAILPPDASHDFVLGLAWVEESRETFPRWAFALAMLLEPRRFEELGDGDPKIYFSGTLLEVLVSPPRQGEDWEDSYDHLRQASRDEQMIQTTASNLSMELAPGLVGHSSPLLDALREQFDKRRSSLADRSLFGHQEGEAHALIDIEHHLSESREILRELKSLVEYLIDESASILLDLVHEDQRRALADHLSSLQTTK